MKRGREGEMRPLWGEGGRWGEWGPGTDDERAVREWIDWHIARPEMGGTKEDFERAVREGRIGRRREGRWTGGRVKEWLREMGVGEERVREWEKGGGEAWMEGGLSRQERRAMELAVRFRREDGRPDLGEIGRHMEGGGMGRATVWVYLKRGREKMERYLKGGEG